jgi:GNAT superfamily N-acetyltransferase
MNYCDCDFFQGRTPSGTEPRVIDMSTVRSLVDGDLRGAAKLHREVLDSEFLSRCGESFMRTYYRAWTHSPGSISLAVSDDQGQLHGVLLGSTDPATHVRSMVRHYGLRLGARLLAYALVHPPLLKELMVTRGRRYSRGVLRLVRSRFLETLKVPEPGGGTAVGEITHVLVHRAAQGRGIGRALVETSVERARVAGVKELMLVTPPDMPARHFYERLGWRAEGSMQSRSGEDFLRYRYTIV